MTATATAERVHTGPVADTPNQGHALARVEGNAAVAVAQPAMTFGEIVSMGDTLVKTGFMPEHIKTGGQAAAIIMTGQELGMKPMRAIRSLQLVKGKVVENADSQLARFKSDGGRAKFLQLNERVAELYLVHPNGDEHTETFTIEDAEHAGLLKPSRNGEPSMYVKFPKPMLRSRAITNGLKSIGWEGGTGTYDPDEAIAFNPPAPSVNGPQRERPAGVTSDGEDLDAMTVEEAFEIQLLGTDKNWGGNGGKRLVEVPRSVLEAARKWMATKLENEDNPRFERQVHAITLVLDALDTQEKLPLEGNGSGAPTNGTSSSPSAPGTSPTITATETNPTTSTSATDNPTVLKPGKIEDALKPNEKPVAPSEQGKPPVDTSTLPF